MLKTHIHSITNQISVFYYEYCLIRKHGKNGYPIENNTPHEKIHILQQDPNRKVYPFTLYLHVVWVGGAGMVILQIQSLFHADIIKSWNYLYLGFKN